MCLLNWYKNWQIEQRISQLSPAERLEIIDKSPYEAAEFQGEGYHVFQKNDPDYYTGYVTSLGEISPQAAEDWIIKTYWKENEEIN